MAEVRPGCNAAAADGQQQIAAVAIENLRDRGCIARRRLHAKNFGARGTRAFGDQIGRERAAGNVDDAQARPPHAQGLQTGCARDQ
jgi:hypothetical protein